MRLVTQRDIDRARAAGACAEGLPEIGTPLAELTHWQLEWVALHIPDLTDGERKILYGLCDARSWWRDGRRHRDDGPAIEHADGHREWWRD